MKRIALFSLLIFFPLHALLAQNPVLPKEDDDIGIDDIENPLIFSYRDADGDGLGDRYNSRAENYIPAGYVTNRDDCDDTNANIGRARTYYQDADGDGYGNPDNTQTSCTQPEGYVSNSGDCDDTDAAMNLATVWYIDRDGDGWGSNELAYGGCQKDREEIIAELLKEDIDSEIERSPSKLKFPYNPDATIDELLNAVSNSDDCDDANANIGKARTYYQDADGDGYGNLDITRTSCTQPEGYVTNRGDCDDANANIGKARTYYQDTDGDGYGNPDDIQTSCTQPDGYVTNRDDCDDTNANIGRARTYYQDADGDGYGKPDVTRTSCTQPDGYVSNSGDCNDSDSSIHPNTFWYKDEDDDGFGVETETLTQCTQPDGYVRNSNDFCPDVSGSEDGCPPLGQRAGLTDENYVYTITPQEAVSTAGQLLDKKHLASVTYYDGLGRPKQTVAVGITPDEKDLVTHIGYDGFGRQHRDYLPVPTSTSDGSYRDDAEALTLTYYNTAAFDDTENPYTERIYEASPLNRVLEVGAPGNTWKADPDADTDHTMKTDYDANGWDDLVRWFEVDFESGDTQQPKLMDKGVYPAGELYKFVTKDENWRNDVYNQDSNKTETYTNKQGQVVLKRAFGDRSWHDTYYVYDDYGNQTFVLPPEVQTYASVWQQGDYKSVSLSNHNIFTTDVNRPAYYGGGAHLMNYNKSVTMHYYAGSLEGHTIKSDIQFDLSELGITVPSGNLSGEVRYITTENVSVQVPISGYLIGNRISISGLPTEPLERISFSLSRVIGELRSDKPLVADQLDELMYQYRYDQRNRLVERKIPGKGWEYIAYDSLDRPVLTADANMRAAEHALKTEYDVFGRVTQTGLVTDVDGSSHTDFNTHLADAIDTLYTQNDYDRYTFDKQGLTLPDNAVTGTQTQGLLTGSRTRVLGTDHFSTTLIGYDAKGRTIYEGMHNPATGVVTQSTHTLDFVGRTTQTTTTQTKNGNTLTKVDDFVYDHAGRLMDHDITLNGQQEDLVQNTYDELGQLTQKTLGGGLQTVDYTYNIRGWLRHINDPDSLGDDLFGFTLDYGSLYNGNIQNTYWATANDGIKRRYQYYYDGLNRLRRAYFYAPGVQWGTYRTFYTYDRNGNIKTLSRRGAQNVGIDHLIYAYTGNQLLSVTDSYNHSDGFTDGNTSGFDYIYDANGNMTEDKNKGISMQYNHLNLPTAITKASQHLAYGYDATGVKQTKTFDTTTTTYTPLAVYKNAALEFVHTPEGYFEPTDDGFIHTYQYKDHLGNNRLSYADSNGNGSIDTPYTSGITVWEDGFEDKSTGDWESVGAMYGRAITGFDNTKAKSGTKSGYITLDTNGVWTDYYVHSNEWIDIDIAEPTLYRFSGWMYLDDLIQRGEFYFFMNKEGETDYFTEVTHVETSQKNQWVYMEKVVLVKSEIKKLNFRIDADSRQNGTVWFDDLKIEQLDNSQNEIVSETNYYPFGLAHKGYNEHTKSSNLGENWKFNGVELNEDMDLELYEMDFRFYDPEAPHFGTIDPMAENFPEWSPYSFSFNNPIRFVDPTGLYPEDCPDCPIKTEMLDEVVVTAPKIESNMPAHMRFDDSSWTSDYSGNLDQYNQEFGTSYTQNGENGTAYSQWQYEHFYKPAYDEMISDMHAAQTSVGLTTLAVPLLVIGAGEALPLLSAVTEAGSLSATTYEGAMFRHGMYRLTIRNSAGQFANGNGVQLTGRVFYQRYGLNGLGQATRTTPVTPPNWGSIAKWGTATGLSGATSYYLYKELLKK